MIGMCVVEILKCAKFECFGKGGTDATEWEDITGSTPMTIQNNLASFTTSVSARYAIHSHYICHKILLNS